MEKKSSNESYDQGSDYEEGCSYWSEEGGSDMNGLLGIWSKLEEWAYLCDMEREGAARTRDASTRISEKGTPAQDGRRLQKKGPKLVQERVIRCAEAKELREWGLGADEPGGLWNLQKQRQE